METIAEREDDDPILVFYKDEIEQIRSLDADGSLQLRELYDQRAAVRDEYRRREALFAELNQYNAKEEWSKAIAHLDRALNEITDPPTRYRLKERRCSYLEFNNQHAEAFAGFRELQQDPNCPADERKQLVRDEGRNLNFLGRLDEALALYDREIAAAVDRPKDRLYFLDWKMNLLLGADRDADAIAACRAVQAAVPPDSKTWAQATANLAWTYEHASQYKEAIAAYRAANPFWQKRGDAFGLLAIARLQHKLGDDASARKSLDEFAAAIPERADRPAKQKKIDRMRRELEERRAVIGGDAAPTQPGTK